MSFGNWVLQTTSTTKTLTLKNTQSVPLTIAQISTSGNFSQTSNCPVSPNTLAPKLACSISVTFTPTAVGVQTGALMVTDDASNSPQTAQLTGTGLIAAGVSPATLSFGNLIVGTTSAAKVATVQNNQTSRLTIAGISTSGDFAQTSNCPLFPNTLGAKLSCTISVTFTPTASGTRTGTLMVNDDAPNTPQIAQLTGTGSVPITLTPSSLAFGNQLFGTSSSAKSLALKNNQTVPLTVLGISTSGDFGETSTCPLPPNTLAAGASCSISISFRPTAVGVRTGVLSVADNAPGGLQQATLSGTGSLTGLVSITVTPGNPNLSIGTQQQFVATGSFSGNQNINISNAVTWLSSAPPIARVNSTGLVQAVTEGAAMITAAYGSTSGTTIITVANPYVTSISVVPDGQSVLVGAYEQFTAILSYSDGSTKETSNLVSWSTSAPAVVSISSSGLAGAVAPGSSVITATAESVIGSATLEVVEPSCTAAPPGLIDWWTGDGNVVDIAGNNSATLRNGATYGAGEVGHAFSFAGQGASILISSPVYSPTAGTLIFWFLPTGAGALTGSFDGTERTPGLAVDAYGNLTFEFGDLSGQALGHVNFNQWSHVALTYSISNPEVTVTVYLNGNPAASAIASQNSSWYPQLSFGAYLGPQEPSFSGLIDEIAIFNQALSSSQIRKVYEAFSGGMCKPTLQSVVLTPANPSIAVGLSQQFDAIGSYSDGTNHDLTSSSAWSSSNPAIAAINTAGQATAITLGTTTVAATLGTLTGSTSLSVVPTLVSLQVAPQNPLLAVGTTQQFTATGTFSDGSIQNLTALVSWSSSQPSVAIIAAGGLARGTSSGQTTIMATAGSVSGSTLLNVTPATLLAITVNPSTPTIAVGTTQQFTASGSFSDGSTQDVTASVSWVSSSLSVAAITTGGLASGSSSGTTTITASSGAISNSAVLTVTNAVLTSITVNPINSSILVGNTQQFTATGTYSDASTQDLTSAVIWNSSNQNVATISGGLASGLAIGTASMSATFVLASGASVSGSTNLTVTVMPPNLVTIIVTPANPSVAMGQNQQFAATGQYSDGSTQDLTTAVIWISSQPSVAAINGAGLASGLSAGSTTICAALGAINASATLRVNSQLLLTIALTPNSPSIALGTNQQLAAIGTYDDGSTLDLTTSATWSSSLPSVAGVNTNGLATSVSTGLTTITATASSVGGSTILTVTPATLILIAISPATQSIPLGTTQSFAATGTFSDGSTQVITSSVQWASSDTTIATIGNDPATKGLATSVASGTCSISATSGAVLSSTALTITTAALVSITVNPPNPSIALGTTQQFTATGTFTDGSTQDLTASATWTSGNAAVATVSSSAVGTSLTAGSASIIATLGGTNGSALLTVTPAAVVSITVSPAFATIPLGLSQIFTAVGTFTDGSSQDLSSSVHWSSSLAAVATVSNTPGTNGRTATFGSGSSAINATIGGVTGSGNLVVISIALAAIEVTPENPSIPIGATQQFTATGIYTDKSTANITAFVTWSSLSAAVATVSNTSATQGLTTGSGSGNTLISATYGSIAGSTSLAVQDSLLSISVSPPISTISPGANQQYSAVATYASGLINDVSTSVSWSSSTPSVATINASGVVLSVATGSTVISASFGSILGSANLSVSLTPIPTNFRADISNGTTGQLFVSWDSMSGALYYNLERSTKPSSGYTKIAACSGLANLKNTTTAGSMRACRDGGLVAGTIYYYQVQACYSSACSSYSTAASNAPVASDCTASQMPHTGAVQPLPAIKIVSSTVDPAVEFLPNNNQYGYYASPGVSRRNILVVDLPGSDETCPAAASFDDTAQRLGFDVICVNYSNLSSQNNICSGDPDCYGNVSEAKFNATGICSTPGQSQCGIDPRTGEPFYLSNSADTVTRRISMMLQYLNTNGYNKNGTNWGNYLSGTTPLWSSVILAGHSQGGDMSTFTAYQYTVARAINLSAPPTATLVNGVETAASWLAGSTATNIRDIYGFVSVDDEYYQHGVYFAVWQSLGFTAENSDLEVKLNGGTSIGLNCNSGVPSHNLSTSASPGPDGDGHTATLFLWNEDIYKFMLID